MATLIQSKQIEGIVTASVITGEFLVSGSLVVTGSNSILGSVTASAISSSFIGDGSGITGITYSQIENTPKFVGGNNITITSSSNVITVHAQLDGTGSDTQNLTIDGDQLTILGGNTITIPTGSNVSDYFELSNIPEGIVSSSIQILGGSGILSGSKTDISSLNTFSSSIQSEVDSLTAATSSYLTSSGSVDFSDVTNKPSGLVSSSDQITITESQISDLTHYGDSDVKTKLDAEGVVSGSVIRELPSGLISGSEQLPSGLISGSSQITITQSQISDLAHTDVTNLNTFTSSIQSEVDSLTSATSSYITEIPQGTISGSEQLPSGLVSSSDQITITESQISDLLHYSDSDVQLYIDSLGVVSGSVVEELPSGVISGSEQLPSGLVSSSDQITITESQISDLTHYDDSDVKKKLDLDGVVSGSVLRTFDGTGVISGSIVEQLPSGVISGSSQVTISSSQISDLVHTQIPIGTISGSEQLPSGLVSSSAQITITESQISDLTHTDISQLNQFTSSIQSEVDSLTSSTASYLTSIDSGIVSSSTQVTELLPSGIISGSSQLLDGSGLISSSEQLPNGLISGSEQLPSGVISGSSQITITESQISDLSHVDITLLNQFSSSIESRVDVISSSTSSYLTELPNGIVSGSVQISSLLPNGVVSGSEQLPSGIISGSTQIVENLPSGVISGSSQITITESQISDLSHVDISSLNSFTSSIERRVSGLSASTSSYLTSSGSVDYSDITNLPSLISGSGQITDASNLVSSSNQIQQLLPSGVISGSTYSELSSSVFDNTELLGEVSGANYLESQSVDGRLDAIEGNLGFYYDLSNTVWNNKYIKSGSGQVSDTPEYITGNQPFKLRLNDDKKLHYSTGSVVYIQNFDRDIRITALVSSSYETGSREIGFTVLQVNGETGSIRINDSYWILTRHTQGFVDSGSYIEASASFDSRIDLIVASGSGADWDINLWGIPQGIVSSSNQQYTASIENGFALTSSLDSVSASLATTIQNVYQSSSNFDGRTLVSGSSQIDFREVTNYVSDEHIDHTTVNINAGDGLDGGGDISDTREIRLNVTSSHFTVGVSDVLVDEGVVKQSTLDDDIINTDFSQSIDTRLNQIVAGEFSDGIITGSGQINITKTQEYTEFSSSIATSIENISGGTSDFTQLTNIPIGLVSGSAQITDGSGIVSGSVLRTFDGTGVLSGSKTNISHLNEFTTSIQSQVDELILSSSTFITSETDSQTLTIVGDQLTISDGNTVTIPTGSSGETIDSSSFATTGSNTFVSTQYFSGSLIPESSDTDDGIHSLGSETNPWKEVFISTASLNFVESEGVVRKLSLSDIVTFDNYPHEYSGTISSSAQITALGFISESVSGTSDFTQLTNVPSGLVSGSSQLEGFISKSANFTTNEIIISDGTNSVVSTDLLTIDPDNNRVGVGTSSPLTKFHIAGDGTNEGQIRLQQANNGADGPDMAFYTSRGTIASPSSVQGGDAHGRINAYPYNGTSFIQAGSFGWSGTDGTGNNTFDIRSRVNGTLAKRIEITSAGKVKFNDSYEFPTSDGSANQILQTDGSGVLSFSDSPTFTNLVLTGNLTVQGITTTTNTNQLNVGDNIIELNYGGSATEGGIYVKDSTNASTTSGSLLWDSTNDYWKLGKSGSESEVITTSNIVTNLPSGLFSGSILPGDNVTIDSSSGDYVISSTASGGGDTSFNGDRAVTNTLLGDLFTESFNAGTSGSIQEFLDAVFFPSYAPTATFSTQTSNLNTNLTADGTVMETISVSDTVDDSPYVVTLTGEDAFRVVPTNADSSSWEIQSIARLSAGTFTYDITVTDTNGASRTYSGRTLEIQQANTGTLSKTGTFYIIESATTGPIYLGSNGRGGSQGGVSVSYSPNYGSQSATNFQSSNSLISINSSTGVLSVGDPISGSGNVSGDTITSTISWEDQYGNVDSDTISVNVTQNNAPDITFTNSSRLNTNQAVDGGGTLVTISFNDTESDSINYDSFQFTDPSGQLTTTKSGGNYLVTANSDLSGSTTYSISATIEDVHGFRSNTESHSFTITQGSNGTLVGDTTMYIIESAVINDNFKDATGFGNGNIADVNVIYSPSAGSQVVQSFNSTNPAILIDSVGNMSLGVNLSGSVTQSGDTIQTLITFQDQYGNIGSGSVTANIFGNNSPSVTFTATSDYDTDGATVGSNAGTITISDTETNSPYNVVLGGTDGGKFNAVPQNSISSSWQVQPTGSLSSNTYSIDITVTDNYGESSILSNKSIVVDEASAGGTVYVYTLPIDGTYVNVTGITSNGSGTPPEPTFATTYGLFTSVVDSDTLGDSTITVEYGGAQTATLRGSASGNNVDDVLSTIGGVNIGGSPASERIFVFIPSGSEMSGVPTSLSTADAGGGSTSGEYIVYVSPDGTFQGTSSGLDNDIKSANIHKLTLDTAVDGFTDWYVIGTEDKFNNSNAYVRMVPSSGSIPS